MDGMSERDIDLFSRVASAALLFVAVFAFVGSPATAQAQESKAEKAKKYYRKGIKAFHGEEYGMAITYLKRANSISPSGTLMYNISLVYSKMGKPQQALDFAEKARSEGDLPEDTSVKNNARIVGYTAALKAREMTPEKTETSDAQASAGSKQTDSSSDQETEGTAPPTQPPPSGGSDTHTLRWIGLSAGLAGLGLAGGGIAVGASVSGKIDDKKAAERNGDFETAGNLHDEIDSQQTLGQILLFSGVGLAVGGTTLFIIDAATSSSGGRAVNVTGGPTRGGFSVGLDVRY